MSDQLKNALTSLFSDACGTVPMDNLPLFEILEQIKSHKYAQKIDKARKLYNAWKAATKGELTKCTEAVAYSNFKKTLPAFTTSGVFKKRAAQGLEKHSGFIMIDLDKLCIKTAKIRETLKLDPYVAFILLSPSGEGLKLGVRIHGNDHEKSFEALKVYFDREYQLGVDPSGKDVSRLCFVSHDPELWINDQAILFELPDSDHATSALLPTTIDPIRLDPSSSVTPSLNDCKPVDLQSSASLHNNCTRALRNMEAHKAALNSLASPELRRLYVQLVEGRFEAKEGQRNSVLIQAVPFLFRAVSPPILMVFMKCFYESNAGLFKDGLDTHMHEAEDMLKSVAVTYNSELNEQHQQIYGGLEEIQRDAFRICRDLAALPDPKKEPFTFYLACGQLGTRLGIHAPQAQRLLRLFSKYGILRLIAKGTRREPGTSGKAGTWEWLLG